MNRARTALEMARTALGPFSTRARTALEPRWEWSAQSHEPRWNRAGTALLARACADNSLELLEGARFANAARAFFGVAER